MTSPDILMINHGAITTMAAQTQAGAVMMEYMGLPASVVLDAFLALDAQMELQAHPDIVVECHRSH